MDFCVVLVAAANLKASQSRSLFPPLYGKFSRLGGKGEKCREGGGSFQLRRKEKVEADGRERRKGEQKLSH